MDHASYCMKKIKDMMSFPARTGSWWADEVMQRVAEGRDVTTYAKQKALEAIARREKQA